MLEWLNKKPEHAVDFKKLKKKDKTLYTLYTECIRKFYLAKLPVLNEISQLPAMVNLHGTDIHSLGVEKGLEYCYELFETGALQLIAQDKDNFMILLHNHEEVHLLMDVEDGKEKE